MAEDRSRINKDRFIRAIHIRKKIRVEFHSKENGGSVIRKCAPMDYGPSRTAKQKNDKFHMWDYESDKGPHTLSLNPEQILEIQILDESFDPSEFITWDTKKSRWFVSRDWGIHS